MQQEPGMPTDELRFKEIEHKYIVDDQFDLGRFRRAVATLGPIRTSAIRVRDRYYLTDSGRARRFLVRHRFDSELHHLTIKAIEADTEVRSEVNLDLGHHAGSQDAQVEAFIERLGLVWSGTVHKDIEVWYFPDCEVVYYQAATASRDVRCVEFEATRKDSLDEALATVARFARATGFGGASRSQRSLPQLLFPELEAALAGPDVSP
jgi:adenylate cyclase class IV